MVLSGETSLGRWIRMSTLSVVNDDLAGDLAVAAAAHAVGHDIAAVLAQHGAGILVFPADKPRVGKRHRFDPVELFSLIHFVIPYEKYVFFPSSLQSITIRVSLFLTNERITCFSPFSSTGISYWN